jgi:hypothetical protein
MQAVLRHEPDALALRQRSRLLIQPSADLVKRCSAAVVLVVEIEQFPHLIVSDPHPELRSNGLGELPHLQPAITVGIVLFEEIT